MEKSRSAAIAHPAANARRSDGVDTSAVPPADDDLQRRLDLRAKVLTHLRRQGFKVSNRGVIGALDSDKESLRRLHYDSVEALRERGRGTLGRHEGELLGRLAVGQSLEPGDIRPKVVLVEDRKSLDGALWRWASLHWSIPVSSGYGRRLRFLVVDEAHDDSLIGLIGLGDPVFALRSRDQAIGWSSADRSARLACVMDAFVLGAVPPYRELLGGKLMALLSGSLEVRQAFREKYGHRTTLIGERDPNAELALITTSSALGRSSVYSRLKRRDGSLAMEAVGYTLGTGDFHLSGEIYEDLAKFASSLDPGRGTQRHERWGAPGFRNRREVLHLSLNALGFDSRALRSHGVQRQVFVNRPAVNAYQFLCGGVSSPKWRGADSVAELSQWWLERWGLPRSRRFSEWQRFEPMSWSLYSDS